MWSGDRARPLWAITYRAVWRVSRWRLRRWALRLCARARLGALRAPRKELWFTLDHRRLRPRAHRAELRHLHPPRDLHRQRRLLPARDRCDLLHAPGEGLWRADGPRQLRHAANGDVRWFVRLRPELHQQRLRHRSVLPRERPELHLQPRVLRELELRRRLLLQEPRHHGRLWPEPGGHRVRVRSVLQRLRSKQPVHRQQPMQRLGADVQLTSMTMRRRQRAGAME